LKKSKKTSQAGLKAGDKQRVLNYTILAITLVIIVVVSAYALTRPIVVELPSNLSRCISFNRPLISNSSFLVQIVINGSNQTIPGGMGVRALTCHLPIYTFTDSGSVHVGTDRNETFTLKDFFLVWGNAYGPDYATFNSGQLFQLKTDANHPIILRVGNSMDSRFENYPLPAQGNSQTNPKIVITYGY